MPFLCAECEGRLNAWETPFATHVFLPYHEQGQTTLPYEGWLLKFCVSVSWRVLTYLRENGHTREMEAAFGADIDAALAMWAAFVRDERGDIGAFEQHLLPVSAIADVDGQLPENVQRYLMRATEIDRIWNSQSALAYAKLGRFMLIGFIREPEAAQWVGTKVEGGNGTIAPSKVAWPSWLLHYLLIDRPQGMAERQATLSERQRQVIDRTQRANPERVLASETIEALIEDIRMQSQEPK